MENNQKIKKFNADFLGVNLNCFTKNQLFLVVGKALEKSNRKPLLIATVNPEILIKAEKNEIYRNILDNFNLKIVDGFGIKLAGFLKRIKTGERMAGADLAGYILEQAKNSDLQIGFVMRKDGLSKEKDLRFKIHDLGIKKAIFLELNSRNFQELNSRNLGMEDVDVLLVGLGAPEQEKFIWQIKDQLPNLKLAMGVGGTFDFWTGRQKRAPKFMRKIGLEWLWRLIIQPKRFFRIWNATAVFLWKNLFLFKNK